MVDEIFMEGRKTFSRELTAPGFDHVHDGGAHKLTEFIDVVPMRDVIVDIQSTGFLRREDLCR